MTPTLNFCDFSCQFCWRTFHEGRFKSAGEWDDPKTIVNGSIEAQRKLISGFGSDHKTRKVFQEAMEPVHFAISLDGEPTLYPHIAGLIREIKSRGYTAFLVSNGTMPGRLNELLEEGAVPTNLYISVYATGEEDYNEIARPFITGVFGKVKESLGMMKKFEESGCRTILRMTCVKGVNMHDPEGLSRLVSEYMPMFVELKGYAWLGESRKRLKEENVPHVEDMDMFARELERSTGYNVREADIASRVVMLVRDEDVCKNMNHG